MTLSVLLFDPDREEWGVAVQSFYLAVGSLVCGARAGAGALVTQSIANPSAIEPVLDGLETGESAPRAIERLLAAGGKPELRQFGVIDSKGIAAHHIGSTCRGEARAVHGDHWLVIGNTAQAGAIEAMAAAMAEGAGSREGMTMRLFQALLRGAQSGGDRRGELAAALKVVRKKGGYLGQGDVVADLRVDADPAPMTRLEELIHWHRLYHEEVPSDRMLPVASLGQAERRLIRKVLTRWMRKSPAAGDAALLAALTDFNLGTRIDPALGLIDGALPQDLSFLSR